MSTPTTWARALLAPRSLAIVGASDDPGKTAGRPLAYLRRSGWAGHVYPVNPRRETVQGEPAWPDLASLPETPEHALILTATDQVRDAVIACGERGVRVATVLATGFAEAGPSGAALQAEIVAAARATGLRLLGPSSLGYADPRHGLFLTANAAFAEPGLAGGRLFAASHSGSMIGALASRGAAKGVAFAGLVSVGVEADLTLGEICEAALEDPQVDGFLLFLESLRHAEDLARFAEAAGRAGKPVVAYKLGRSAQAAELAQSHTGALAGEDAVADAFLEACGIARVDTLDGVLEAPGLASRVPAVAKRPRPPVVGVVTTTGGGAAMVVDQLGVRGIQVRGPEPDTWARLAAGGVAAERGRVVDLTMAGVRPEVMKTALGVLTAAPEFDLLVVVAGSSARFYPELLVQPILDTVAPSTPIAVFLAPEAGEALQRLNRAGVPAFRTPESCADAVAAVLRRRPARSLAHVGRAAAGEGRLLNEADAYRRLEAAGLAAAPHQVLAVGEPAAAAQVPFPVVAKVLSRDLGHKSDVGGVVLNIADPAALDGAIATILASVRGHCPGLEPEGVLVQAMVRGVGEVLIGFRRDPDAGPIVVVAPGGVLAELAGAPSLRLAPVSEAEAREMIEALPALRALSGYRGRAAGDVAALARAIAGLSRLADDEAVVEAEVNPLIVLVEGKGVVAVDAVVRVREAP